LKPAPDGPGEGESVSLHGRFGGGEVSKCPTATKVLRRVGCQRFSCEAKASATVKPRRKAMLPVAAMMS
jgi:hypothetical protein